MARNRLSGLRRFSGLRFGRPDKAQPPSGNGYGGDNAGWRVTAYPAYAVSAGSGLVGRIRRSRNPAVMWWRFCRMARNRLSGLRRFSGLRFGRPDKAQPPSGNGVVVIMPDGA